MNEAKWTTTDEVGRLLDHVAAVLPEELVVFVAFEIADLSMIAGPTSGADELRRALDDVAAFLAGTAPRPTRADCWALESRLENESSEGGLVALDLLATVTLGARHLRSLGESAVSVLSSGTGDHDSNLRAAKSLLGDQIRALVPWIATPQVAWRAVDGGTFETEDLRCETANGRLLRCVIR